MKASDFGYAVNADLTLDDLGEWEFVGQENSIDRKLDEYFWSGQGPWTPVNGAWYPNETINSTNYPVRRRRMHPTLPPMASTNG